MEALLAGNVAKARKLLKEGDAPLPKGSRGETALTAAARLRASDVVERFVKCGADVAGRNAMGQSPLMVACAAGRLATVKALLQHGAPINDVNSKRETPLTYAIVWGHGSIVRLLLNAGARPDWPSRPWTPLMYAAFEGNAAIARVLLRNGASPRRRDRWRRTAADIAEEARHATLAGELRRAAALSRLR